MDNVKWPVPLYVRKIPGELVPLSINEDQVVTPAKVKVPCELIPADQEVLQRAVITQIAQAWRYSTWWGEIFKILLEPFKLKQHLSKLHK